MIWRTVQTKQLVIRQSRVKFSSNMPSFSTKWDATIFGEADFKTSTG